MSETSSTIMATSASTSRSACPSSSGATSLLQTVVLGSGRLTSTVDSCPTPGTLFEELLSCTEDPSATIAGFLGPPPFTTGAVFALGGPFGPNSLGVLVPGTAIISTTVRLATTADSGTLIEARLVFSPLSMPTHTEVFATTEGATVPNDDCETAGSTVTLQFSSVAFAAREPGIFYVSVCLPGPGSGTFVATAPSVFGLTLVTHRLGVRGVLEHRRRRCKRAVSQSSSTIA